MSKPVGWEDKPKNPTLSDHHRGVQYSTEWNVWAQSKYQAEFTVIHHKPGSDKPVVNASGEGITIPRALFAAAAGCVDAGADRYAVLQGLSVALGCSPKIKAVEKPVIRVRRGWDFAPRLKRTHTRDSKLKNLEPIE